MENVKKNKLEKNDIPVVKGNAGSESFLANLGILKSERGKSEKSLLKVASSNEKARLSILGLGYIGAVSAACFSSRGHRVICVDSDESKVAMVNQGSLSMREEGVTEILGDGCEKGILSAMCDVTKAVVDTDISVVSIEAPIGLDGVCDLSYLENVSHDMGNGLKEKDDYHLIVYRTMVPPKTVKGTMIPILEETSGKVCGKDFGVCFNPEFSHQGTAIKDFYLRPKIIIGAIDKRSADYATKLYEGIEGELVHTDIESAEFIKYVDNTWQALKAGFGHEVAELCKIAGIDYMDSVDFLPTDAKADLAFTSQKPFLPSGLLPNEEARVMALVQESTGNTPLIDSLIQRDPDKMDYALNMVKKMGAVKVGFIGLGGSDYSDKCVTNTLKMMMELENNDCVVSYFDQNINPQELVDMGASTVLSESFHKHYFQLVKHSDIIFVTEKNEWSKEIIKVAKLYCPVVDLVGAASEYEGAFNYYNIC